MRERRISYGFAELLEERHGLPLKTTVREPAASASMHQVDQLLIAEVQKVVEVNSSEGELLEGSLLAGLSSIAHQALKKKVIAN